MTARHRALAALVCVSSLDACAGMRTMQTPVPVEALNQQLSHAIALSQASLDSAIELRDTVRLGVLVAPNGELVTSDGRVVHGAFAVARALLGNDRPAAEYAMLLVESEPELCIDGGLQTGTYSVSRADSSQSVGVEAGAYSFRWVMGTAGAQLGRIALRRNAQASERAVGSCRTLAAATFRQRRLELSIGPLGLGSTVVRHSLENDLKSAGWTTSAAMATKASTSSAAWVNTDAVLHHGGADAILYVVNATAAYRFAPSTLIQSSVQLIPESGDLATFNPSTSSRLVQRYSMRNVTVELMREWSGFRLGVGPVVVTSDWRERYEKLVLQNGSYAVDFSTITDGHWTHLQFGGLADAEYVRALTPFVFMGIGVSARTGASATMDGVPTHSHWSAGMTDVQLGARLGLAW